MPSSPSCSVASRKAARACCFTTERWVSLTNPRDPLAASCEVRAFSMGLLRHTLQLPVTLLVRCRQYCVMQPWRHRSSSHRRSEFLWTTIQPRSGAKQMPHPCGTCVCAIMGNGCAETLSALHKVKVMYPLDICHIETAIADLHARGCLLNCWLTVRAGGLKIQIQLAAASCGMPLPAPVCYIVK